MNTTLITATQAKKKIQSLRVVPEDAIYKVNELILKRMKDGASEAGFIPHDLNPLQIDTLITMLKAKGFPSHIEHSRNESYISIKLPT